MNQQVFQTGKRRIRWLVWIPLFYAGIVYAITAVFPAPVAVSLSHPQRLAGNVKFLADTSWLDIDQQRQLQQELFDTVYSLIAEARRGLVVDMFLFNAWQGPVRETHRALSAELVDALVNSKSANPGMPVTVVSDPINEVYGGLDSVHLDKLRKAGIDVVLTDLVAMQDSNKLYSGLWRWLVRPFGNAPADTLPNPFGEGKVSLRSYLALVNFKANHRKLVIVDRSDATAAETDLVAVVMSANPHDGSSAHRNVALQFDGNAVVDLLRSERALLDMSGAAQVWQRWPSAWLAQMQLAASTSDAIGDAEPTLQIVSESHIEKTVLEVLASAQSDTRIDLLMFYLSDRHVIRALKAAHTRGVNIRVLLDINSDAFGRKKNGVPNKPVAAELRQHGITVRWCATAGEQCHAKMLLWQNAGGQGGLVLGSGNYTRRNLDNFNMETDVVLRAAVDHPVMLGAANYFAQQWQNTPGRRYSVDYDNHADESLWLALQYRVMEATGLSTF